MLKKETMKYYLPIVLFDGDRGPFNKNARRVVERQLYVKCPLSDLGIVMLQYGI